MPALPPGADPDEVTAAARRVLLDALDVLRDQRDAVVLVGAQAVYLRSRDADFSTSAYTTDADLGLNPALLGAAPLLEVAMTAGGFGLRDPNQPGLWVRNEAGGNRRPLPHLRPPRPCAARRFRPFTSRPRPVETIPPTPPGRRRCCHLQPDRARGLAAKGISCSVCRPALPSVWG